MEVALNELRMFVLAKTAMNRHPPIGHLFRLYIPTYSMQSPKKVDTRRSWKKTGCTHKTCHSVTKKPHVQRTKNDECKFWLFQQSTILRLRWRHQTSYRVWIFFILFDLEKKTRIEIVEDQRIRSTFSRTRGSKTTLGGRQIGTFSSHAAPNWGR